ncbi:hypothetical protein ACE38W_02240 [Chitinophaga sp. Hz27]|uniref:hypothetical protein n=1 Tax=Chitinophaga sp. Hz27 TaxID=3347169 RepID=UPI0035DAE11B
MTYDSLCWALLSGAIGISVGLSELLNRYRTFHYILINRFSYVYMFINFWGAVVAYVIIKAYHLNFGPINRHELGMALVAGFGAMVFLRSSFFSYKDGKNKIVEVGPSLILSIFLKTAERQFDQILSERNMKKISEIMSMMDLTIDAKDLISLITKAMSVLSEDEKEELSNEIVQTLDGKFQAAIARKITLGLVVIKYTGGDLFLEIIRCLQLGENTAEDISSS